MPYQMDNSLPPLTRRISLCQCSSSISVDAHTKKGLDAELWWLPFLAAEDKETDLWELTNDIHSNKWPIGSLLMHITWPSTLEITSIGFVRVFPEVWCQCAFAEVYYLQEVDYNLINDT